MIKIKLLFLLGTLTSALLFAGCQMPPSQTQSDSYKNQIPASVGSKHIAMTKHNRFVRVSDSICVIKAYDERNGNILYRQSGAYIQKITYDKFAQHSPATYLLQSYDEHSARAEVQAKGCNILVHPKIIYWAEKTFESQNIVVKLSMYDAMSYQMVNEVTLSGSAIRQGFQHESGLSTIDHALEQYINWLYKN